MNPTPYRAAGVFVLLLMLVVGSAEAGLSCGRITGLLIPCLGYLNRGGRVPRSCCQGVRTVFAASRTTADRRGACRCLKATSIRFHIRATHARTLPRSCRVSIPYLISPATNCNRIR